MPVEWASCEDTYNCCSPDYICSLYIGSKTVSAGSWTCESGIKFGIDIPEWFSLLSDGNVSNGGSTEITVEAGIKATCHLQRCQTSSLAVGPYYRFILRTVPCLKACFNPKDPNTPCSEYQQVCASFNFNKYSTLIYLLDPCKVLGVCGIPTTPPNCPSCVDPLNPNCGN